MCLANLQQQQQQRNLVEKEEHFNGKHKRKQFPGKLMKYLYKTNMLILKLLKGLLSKKKKKKKRRGVRIKNQEHAPPQTLMSW
jgi:hypothetical protein